MMLSKKFYKLLVEVASRRDLRATDKLVLAVLTDRIGENECCWPGMRSLAKDTGLRVATIVESLGRLEKHGEIIVDRQTSGKKNRYRLASKNSTETVTVESAKRYGNRNGGVTEKVTEALRKPEQNQTDTLNQTTASTSFTFVLRSKKHRQLPQSKLNEYKQTFSNIDVEHELRKAAQWLIDNPHRRKTPGGMTRFLGSWLGRAKPSLESKRGDPYGLSRFTHEATEEEIEKLEKEGVL